MNLQSEDIGEVRMKFDPGEATGEMRLEFGDIKAISLTRRIEGSVCRSLLKPEQIRAPRSARTPLSGPPERRIRVYRAAYPCLVPPRGELRTIEAEFPPHAPRQLLLFGRGFLPAARQIDSPKGPAPAQPYAYTGPDDLKAIEDAARRAVVADFPEYAEQLVRHPAAAGSPRRYFAFNWGPQKAQSGNQVDSVGVYDVRSCAG